MPGQEFLDALARLPAGVVVISSCFGEEYRGMTASTFVSVSLQPPMASVALERESATLAAIKSSKAFSASVLSRDQEFLADRFAGRAPTIDSRWSTVPHRLGNNGVPVIIGCAAWLECGPPAFHPAGDHELVVAAIERAEVGSGDPLILWDRAFWTLR